MIEPAAARRRKSAPMRKRSRSTEHDASAPARRSRRGSRWRAATSSAAPQRTGASRPRREAAGRRVQPVCRGRRRGRAAPAQPGAHDPAGRGADRRARRGLLVPRARRAEGSGSGSAGAGETPLALIMTHMRPPAARERQRTAHGHRPGDQSDRQGAGRAAAPGAAARASRASWSTAGRSRRRRGRLPPGASASFNSAEVNVPPGGDELTITLGDSGRRTELIRIRSAWRAAIEPSALAACVSRKRVGCPLDCPRRSAAGRADTMRHRRLRLTRRGRRGDRCGARGASERGCGGEKRASRAS